MCSSGQHSAERGGFIERGLGLGEMLPDKDLHGSLICESLIRDYKVSCWVDEQSDTAGTNKHSEDQLRLQRTGKQLNGENRWVNGQIRESRLCSVMFTFSHSLSNE